MKQFVTDKVRASIHFKLKQKKVVGKVKPNSIVIKSKLINYCDENIECWCEINCTSNGKKIVVPNFYNKKSSFDLQPFSSGRGWFGVIKHLMAKDEYKKLKKLAVKPAMKELLYFDAKFSYNVFGKEEVIENVSNKFYYDFYRKCIVADY